MKGMVEVLQQLLPKGHRCRPGGSFTKTSITIHSTANARSTAQNERAWLSNPSNNGEASWHYVVGEDVIIQAVPDNEEAWHAGNRQGNCYSIGIELVESGNREKVLENAAEFAAAKMKAYGFGLDSLVRHYDWTGKNCPRILIDRAYIQNNMDWEYFLGRVKHFMKEAPEWKKVNVQQAKDRGILTELHDPLEQVDMGTICTMLNSLYSILKNG